MRRIIIGISILTAVVLMAGCVPVTVQPAVAPSPTTAAPPTAAPPTAAPPTAAPPTAAPAQPTAPPTATTAPTKAPAQPTVTTAPATPAPQAATGGQQKINLDDYFPKGPGREMVLRDCTTCHSFAPVIMGQRPRARWLSLKEDHKDKASGVAPADYDVEFDYLIENFNDTKPEPKLPDWFLKQQPGIGE